MSDLIRRQDAIAAMCNDCGADNGDFYPNCGQKEYCAKVQALVALPSAMREPTKEERESVAEYVGKASTQTSENFYDLISRSDAKQQISEWATIITNPTLLDKDATMVVLDSLPSADATIGDYPNDLISRSALMEYCSNQKSKSIDNNDIARFPSAETVHIEVYRDLYEKYVELKHASAEAVSREDIIGYIDRVRNSGLGRNKALEYIRKYVERTESAEAVQGGEENEFIQILKSWETNKVDAISKRFISDAILQKISELNAQGEKAIPIAREFIRFKRFVDGLTPIRTDAGQGWIPCSERLPKTGDSVLVTYSDGEVSIVWGARPKAWVRYIESNNLIYPIAWMTLPTPYKGGEE